MEIHNFNIHEFKCQKGELHKKQSINTVCLNPECIYNPLCCILCVQQSHSSHKTIPMKKFIQNAKQVELSLQKKQKEQAKKICTYSEIDTDIVQNIFQTSKKQTFQKLQTISDKILSEMKKIELSFQRYFFKCQLKSKYYCSPKAFQTIEEETNKVEKAQTLAQFLPCLQKILVMLESFNEAKQQGDSAIVEIPQNQCFYFLKRLNQKVFGSISRSLGVIKAQLVAQTSNVSKSIREIDNLFKKDIYRFSDQLKPQSIWVPYSYKTESKSQNTYRIILMEPSISQFGQITSFRFKIKKSHIKWIAIGIGHKKLIEEKGFTHDFNTPGHGCYGISTNGGSWSHDTDFMNNLLRSFEFDQDDVVTCIVDKRTKIIYFIKEPLQNYHPTMQKQTFSLSYTENEELGPLHPCVVFFYDKDQVEYFPSIQNLLPQYDYIFSTKLMNNYLKIHQKLVLKKCNENIVHFGNCYDVALLERSIESQDISLKFAFRITALGIYSQIGLGICHSKYISKRNFRIEDHKQFSQGFYTIFSDGMCFSYLDKSLSEGKRSFKFYQGDIINCEILFGKNLTDKENKIVFRKGSDRFQLNFKRIKGDMLYPCAIIYNNNDIVTIVPNFS